MCFFFFKQKTAYEMCGRDWSSDVCSSDLVIETVNGYYDVLWTEVDIEKINTELQEFQNK